MGFYDTHEGHNFHRETPIRANLLHEKAGIKTHIRKHQISPKKNQEDQSQPKS